MATLVFEPVCVGAEHAPFNAGMAASALSAWPGEQTVFAADPGHVEAVRSLLDSSTRERIVWRTLAVGPRRLKALPRRVPMEWRTLSSALALGRTAGPVRRAIATGVLQANLLAYRARWWTSRGLPPIMVILHRPLGSLLQSRTGRWSLFRAWPPAVRVGVLGSAPLQASLQADAAAGSVVRSIPHPYIFPPAPAERPPATPPVFGFLGAANAGKGFPLFVTLAERVRARGANARFVLVGRLAPDCRHYAGHPAVEMPPAPFDPLPREQYDRMAAAIDYTVFTYEESGYRSVSSGSILDALSWCKPCLALRCSMIEEYFSAMGAIGEMAPTLEELEAIVCRLAAQPDPAAYLGQSRTVLRERGQYAPPAVGSRLREIFGEMGA